MPTLKPGESVSTSTTTVKPTPHAIFTKNIDDVLLVYSEELSYDDATGNWVVVSISDIVITNKTAEFYEVKVTAEGNNVLTFGIHLKYGNWYMEDAKWNDQEYLFPEMAMGITVGYSYHCGPGMILRARMSTKRVKWSGLQIEPSFEGKIEKFSDSWDCVGFTTPAIWAGLFVTFILIFILFIGFGWISDIKTMDRFDDPKGKTIIITEME